MSVLRWTEREVAFAEVTEEARWFARLGHEQLSEATSPLGPGIPCTVAWQDVLDTEGLIDVTRSQQRSRVRYLALPSHKAVGGFVATRQNRITQYSGGYTLPRDIYPIGAPMDSEEYTLN